MYKLVVNRRTDGLMMFWRGRRAPFSAFPRSSCVIPVLSSMACTSPRNHALCSIAQALHHPLNPLCLQVIGFPDRAAANSFMLLNPNKVTAAVHLDVTAPQAVGFTLQTNSTVSCLRVNSLLATQMQEMLLTCNSQAFWVNTQCICYTL